MNKSESGRRAKRVGQIIRDSVAQFLVGSAADARLSGIVITDVTVSDDLSIANISFRFLRGTPADSEQRQTLRQLQLLTGRLRRNLGPQLQLRRVPELRFLYDAGQDARQRIEDLLAEIRTETRK